MPDFVPPTCARCEAEAHGLGSSDQHTCSTEVREQERVQIAFELIGLVPVNGEHPDDFELNETDWERLKTCSCAHCQPGDGICPMTVQAMIGEYLTGRDDDLAHALAPRLATNDDVTHRLRSTSMAALHGIGDTVPALTEGAGRG